MEKKSRAIPIDTEETKAYRRTLKDTLTLQERTKANAKLHKKIRFLHQMFCYTYNIGLLEYTVRDQKLSFTNLDPDIHSLLLPVKEFQKKSTRRLFDSHGPLFSADSLGFIHVLISHFDEQGLIQYYCGLGPVFTSAKAKADAPQKLSALSLSVKENIACRRALAELPVIPLSILVEYTIMMHGCMNNEEITPGDIHYNYTAERDYPEEETATESSVSKNSLIGNAIALRKMWNAIQSGDVSYIECSTPSLFTDLNTSNYARIDYLRLVKDYCLMIADTCCNAAVHGGLPVVEANDVLDNYLYQFEQNQTEADLMHSLRIMEMDYAARVKRFRQADICPIVDECLSYIHSHINNDLKLEDVAKALHYSPNYLGKRFRETTGMTFRAYVTAQKITLAKELLAINGTTAAEISQLCHFSSASYFSKVFLKQTGMTPQEYARTASKRATEQQIAFEKGGL